MRDKFLQFYGGWYKFVNFLVVLTTFGLLALSNYLMGTCKDVSCLYNRAIGIYEPLSASLQYFIYLPLAYLVLPTIYFRRWLWYVASWGIPLIILLVSSTSVYHSGILGGREFDAIMFTVVFMLFSGITTFSVMLYDAWRWYRLSRNNTSH